MPPISLVNMHARAYLYRWLLTKGTLQRSGAQISHVVRQRHLPTPWVCGAPERSCGLVVIRTHTFSSRNRTLGCHRGCLSLAVLRTTSHLGCSDSSPSSLHGPAQPVSETPSERACRDWVECAYTPDQDPSYEHPLGSRFHWPLPS